jgi:dTDP-4-dehydrorhamnose reductase
MKKVLLLGSAGMAGQVLKVELLKLSGQIELIDIARSEKISQPKICLDLTNFTELENIINKGNFDFIINCAGVLNNLAENNPEKAIMINSYLPHFLEKVTSVTFTKIIHISTDCVFSGKLGGYIESDFKDGLGFYAQSKALGELDNKKDLTIRTSIIGPDFNSEGIGLFKWILNQKGPINGYKNAFWSGVTTIELAKTIIEFINQSQLPTGIIHLTNCTKINKFDLLSLIKNVFELNEIQIIKYYDYVVDKSFVNTRDDIILKVPSYLEMILEMKQWIIENKY